MLVLGIESSCDETAASVVQDGVRVLSNTIATQDDLHAEYAGVVPEIASRAHADRILPVVRRALCDAGCGLSDIDAIAAGHRPGLIGSLLVGVTAAKMLAWSLGKPFVGVDHVHAHLYAGLLDREEPMDSLFPAVGLVVSGGHTSMYRCESPLVLARLGATIDDAIGEAYDKTGTMLGLGFPGGPKLDKLARQGNERAHDFPISRLSKESLDFSYSGLKTAVLYTVRGTPRRDGTFPREFEALNEQEKVDIAASFQRAAVGAVVLKMKRAFAQAEESGQEIRSILVGGGVSANSRLRAELTKFAADRGVELRLPSMRYCLDNAAMLAGLAFQRLAAGESDSLSLRPVPTTAC